MKLVRSTAAIGLATALLAGCSEAAEQPRPEFSELLPSASTSANPWDTYDEIFNPCYPLPEQFDINPARRTERATQCVQQLRSGKIAVVGFGISPNVTAAVAREITEKLPLVTADRATKTAITMKAVPLTASPEATEQFGTASPDCVDQQDEVTSAAFAADSAMKLGQYALVVGLTPKPVCVEAGKTPNVGGVAYSFGGHRLIDILSADTVPPKPDEITKSTYQRYRNDATNAIHEALHQLGLGHANAMYPTDGGESPFDTQFDTTGTVTLDIYRLVANSDLYEYQDHINIMGQGSLGVGKGSEFVSNNILNEVQREWLRIPRRNADQKIQKRQVQLGNRKHTVSAKDPAQSFVTMQLDTEISAEDFARTSATAYGKQITYDQMAFVPKYEAGEVIGMDAYLIGTDTRTVLRVGDMYRTGHPTWIIQAGQRKLTIHFADSKATFLQTRN